MNGISFAGVAYLIFGLILSCSTTHAFNLQRDSNPFLNDNLLSGKSNIFRTNILERLKRHADLEENSDIDKQSIGNKQSTDDEFVHIYNHDLDQYFTDKNSNSNNLSQSENDDESQNMGEDGFKVEGPFEKEALPNEILTQNEAMIKDKSDVLVGKEEAIKTTTKAPVDIHGGIKMGVKNHQCDDGATDLILDWDNRTNWEYTCTEGETLLLFEQDEWQSTIDILPSDKVPRPIHTCMRDHIEYEDIPPRGGSHRPLWAMFGEYLYCPPQRWVHNLEHGSAVFLFHPCADSQEIQKLKQLARNCIRKHVITPYRPLGTDMPFAVVTWGCRWQGNYINEDEIIHFIRAHAQQTYESSVERDGKYTWGLISKAPIVSDLQESVLCPASQFDAEHMAQQDDVIEATTAADETENLTLPTM